MPALAAARDRAATTAARRTARRPPKASTCSRRRVGPGRARAAADRRRDPGAPAARARPRPSRPSCGWSARCASDPRIEASTIQAPALSSAAVDRQAEPARPHRADAPDQGGRTHRRGHVRGAKTSCTRSATRYIPAAGFPRSDVVAADRRARVRGGLRRPRPTARSRGSSLAVLVITYFVLLRAFRSVVLPLKAVLLNLLSVSAAYGVLVLVFQHGWGIGARLPQLARRSKPGSRSSCSRRSSGSRWTTRCSCSRACARSGTATTTTSARSPTASSTPAASSPRPR